MLTNVENCCCNNTYMNTILHIYLGNKEWPNITQTLRIDYLSLLEVSGFPLSSRTSRKNYKPKWRKLLTVRCTLRRCGHSVTSRPPAKSNYPHSTSSHNHYKSLWITSYNRTYFQFFFSSGIEDFFFRKINRKYLDICKTSLLPLTIKHILTECRRFCLTYRNASRE